MTITAAVSAAPHSLSIIQTASPEPREGEVKLEVAAAAVNPVDAQTLAGIYHDLGWIDQPEHTGLGWDVAGTITAIGPAVSDFAVGQVVAGLHAGVDHSVGTFADAVILPADAVALVPDRLGVCEAATVPLNALTADQALTLLGPPSGRLLVTGAAGGVGGYALALAVRRGWEVFGWARATDRDFIESTGARVINGAPVQPMDAVLDAGVFAETALEVLRDNGRYVGVVPPAIPEPRRGIVPQAVMVQADGRRLAELLGLAADGILRPRIARTVGFDGLASGLADVGSPGVRGRIVLEPGLRGDS